MKLCTYMRATSGVNWTSPSEGPNQPDWFEFYQVSPTPRFYPPSLKHPKKVDVPNSQDGWEKGASKAKRAKAKQDLKDIHQKVLRQIGRPAIAVTAPMPTFPSIMNIT